MIRNALNQLVRKQKNHSNFSTHFGSEFVCYFSLDPFVICCILSNPKLINYSMFSMYYHFNRQKTMYSFKKMFNINDI